MIGGWIDMVELYEHNLEAFNEINKMIESGTKKIAVPRATGSGKTYLIGALAEQYNNDRKLVLEPTRPLLDSIKEKFEEFGIANTDFLTYQKLIRLNDEDIASMDYKLIFLDECHHGTAPIWGEKVNYLMETHSDSIIFGTSATTVRNDGVNVVETLFEGNAISELPLSVAIARKVLPCPHYITAIYRLDDEFEKLKKRVEASTNTKEEKHEFYEKMKIMQTHFEKSYGIPTILNKYIKAKNGRYLVFCKNRKHLDTMRDVVIDWFRTAGLKDVHSYAVYSDYPDKEKDYKEFCEDNSDALKVLFSINMLNEGLHIKNISGVLMLRTTQSNLIYLQQLGRLVDAGNIDKYLLVFDFVNNFSSINDGIGLLREIQDAVAREKESDPDFDDSGFDDIDTFFVLENVIEIKEMFAEIEGRLEGSWENGLKHFDKYVREHNGDVLVPKNYKDEDGFCTGNWVSNKREEYKNKILLPKRVEELNKRSFIWDVKKYDFTLKLEAIKRFISENGRLPKSMSKDWYEKKLGGFLVKERIYHNRDKVQYPKWRKDAMEEIEGFSWNPKEEYFLLGCKHYEDYLSKTSNFSIPKGYRTSDGFNLDSWVSAQKNKYRKNKLTDDEKDMLNRIGFCFSINNDNFDKLLKLMKEYMEVNHCDSDIPQATIYKGENLGAFVSSMRANYKNKSISNYRKEKLESIGFIWNTKDKQWNDNLQWFTKYKKEHGGKIDISKKDSTLKHYYYWLIDQRMLYRKGQMREDRRKLFEQVIMS